MKAYSSVRGLSVGLEWQRNGEEGVEMEVRALVEARKREPSFDFALEEETALEEPKLGAKVLVVGIAGRRRLPLPVY